MLGYKGLNSDLTGWNHFQYEVGKTYTMDPDQIKLDKSGYHFSQYPMDVLGYYNNPDDKYALVKADGKILEDETKLVTNHITIIKLLTKKELILSQPNQVFRKSGTKEWWVYDLLHRLDGPAREYSDQSQEWYKDGILHRLDGPAIDYSNGYKEWWVEGHFNKSEGPEPTDKDRLRIIKFMHYVDEHRNNTYLSEIIQENLVLIQLKGDTP